VNITLSVNRTWIGKDGVMNDQVIFGYLAGMFGYLRGNVRAARGLGQAIDNALLLAAPTTEDDKAN
jgi:hypothetical protein